MTGGVLGGGVIFVVAALLWAAVLVPAWIRRREFRAAERNAMRLQRTLRVLAETTEVPQEVRLEATAKEALVHEKLLRSAQKQQEAERAATLAEARAAQVRAEIRAQQVKRQQAAMQRAARLRRPLVRRVRAVAALTSLAGIIGLLVGAGLALAGSGAAVLIWSALLGAVGIGTLVLLAPGRAQLREMPAERVAEPIAAESAVLVEAEVVAPAGETEDAAEAHAAAQRAAAERIERARAMARARAQRPAAVVRENQTDSILLREARRQVSEARSARTGAAAQDPAPMAPSVSAARETTAAGARPADPRTSSDARPATARAAAEARPARPRTTPQQQAARDRLRQMGVVGDTAEGMPDLSAALRRHRRVG